MVLIGIDPYPFDVFWKMYLYGLYYSESINKDYRGDDGDEDEDKDEDIDQDYDHDHDGDRMLVFWIMIVIVLMMMPTLFAHHSSPLDCKK